MKNHLSGSIGGVILRIVKLETAIRNVSFPLCVRCIPTTWFEQETPNVNRPPSGLFASATIFLRNSMSTQSKVIWCANWEDNRRHYLFEPLEVNVTVTPAVYDDMVLPHFENISLDMIRLPLVTMPYINQTGGHQFKSWKCHHFCVAARCDLLRCHEGQRIKIFLQTVCSAAVAHFFNAFLPGSAKTSLRDAEISFNPLIGSV